MLTSEFKKAAKEKATEFYFKSIPWYMQDWIEGGPDACVPQDVLELVLLLEATFEAGLKRGYIEINRKEQTPKLSPK